MDEIQKTVSETIVKMDTIANKIKEKAKGDTDYVQRDYAVDLANRILQSKRDMYDYFDLYKFDAPVTNERS